MKREKYGTTLSQECITQIKEIAEAKQWNANVVIENGVKTLFEATFPSLISDTDQPINKSKSDI